MHDISLHILDLIENSVRAGASVVAITVAVEPECDLLRVCVEDNGSGLKAPPAEVLDPFYTTKSKRKPVGLGLSLFRAAAEQSGGSLTLDPSSDLGGVRVEALMRISHVDRPPLGDLATTMSVVVSTNPGVDFRLCLAQADAVFAFSVAECARRNGLTENEPIALASMVLETVRTEMARIDCR